MSESLHIGSPPKVIYILSADATFYFPAEHQNNCCFHHIFNISSLTWLSLSDKLEEAAASLQWSRGPNFDIQPELEEILKRRSKQYFQKPLNISALFYAVAQGLSTCNILILFATHCSSREEQKSAKGSKEISKVILSKPFLRWVKPSNQA